MIEKDFYFLIIIGACIGCVLLVSLLSRISDKRFNKKYFRKGVKR